MTVTPVLADQLEDAGVRERLREFLRRAPGRGRRGRPRRGPARVPRRLRGRARPLPPRAASCSTRSAATRCAPSARRRPAGSSSPPRPRPTRCCRCWRRGRRCGFSSMPGSARTGAGSAGPVASGCRSAPMSPGSRRRSRSTGCAGSASTRAPTGRPSTPSPRSRPRRGRSRCRSTGRPSAGSGRSTAIRPIPPTPSSPASRCAGSGSGRWAAAPTSPRPPAPRPGARPREFLAACAARLREFSAARGRRGLLVFAIDTELLGHWWSEGAAWLGEVVAAAEGAGVRLLTATEALAEHEPVGAPDRGLQLGRGEGPQHLGLAAGGRPRLGREAARAAASCAPSRGLDGPAAMRAARELLAVQASDWAFLDRRGEAGDYAYQRATRHAEAALEAIDSPQPPTRTCAR